MKKLNLFLKASGIISDITEYEKTRAELTVHILSTINKNYTIDEYREDAENAVMLFIPDVYKYIFWKNTNDIELYDKLYNEFIVSFKQINLPVTITEDLDHIIKYLCHFLNIGILGESDGLLLNALDDSDILKYFKYLNVPEFHNFTKPDPRYFKAILNSADVKASESIIIGDRIDNDIIPAKQIGMMKTIRLKTGLHKNQKARYPFEFPDYEINDINMLNDIMKEIISG